MDYNVPLCFLLLSAYLILKPVRNSLFWLNLGNLPRSTSPHVYSYCPGCRSNHNTLWSSFGKAESPSTYRRHNHNHHNLPHSVLVVNNPKVDGLVYVFYIWVSLFGVFTTSQFWLLANYVLTLVRLNDSFHLLVPAPLPEE